jgi:hypothetical protein
MVPKVYLIEVKCDAQETERQLKVS